MGKAGDRFELRFYQSGALVVDAVPLRATVTVGRSPENAVVLQHKSVSRRHATFVLEDQEGSAPVKLRDEGSTNGSIVNGRCVRGETVEVRPTDTIQLGVFQVELLDRPDQDSRGPLAEIEAKVVYETLPSKAWRHPNQRLWILSELASLAAPVSAPAILGATARGLAACLPFEVLYLQLEEPLGKPTIVTLTPRGPCSPAEVRVSRELVEKCLREGVAILADNSELGATPGDGETAALRTLRSALCVPLSSYGRHFGVIYASSPLDVVYTPEDLQFLILAASHVMQKGATTRAFQMLQAGKRKLEAVLASLQEGVLLVDQDFRVLEANPAAVKIFGGADLVGRRLDEALGGFSYHFTLETLPAQGSFQLEEHDRGEGAGRGRAVRKVFAGTVSQNTAGDAAWRYALCLRDVSQTQHVERLKCVFVNRLAHKIITPLTVVCATNELVTSHLERLVDPELRDVLHQSLRHAARCVELVRKFVDCTAVSFKHGAGMKWAEHRLEELLDGAACACAPLLEEKGFRVRTLFPTGSAMVQGDRELLGLVFQHVLENAVKFGRPGGTLMVGVEEREVVLKLSFLDDGPGIPPGEMEHLGQLLYQVDPEDTGEVPGAGMGLWLAQQIVQWHAGELKLRSPVSPEGTGTLVEVILPRKATAPPRAEVSDATGVYDSVARGL
ncbi:MAG: FHA domain-containing protein [Planctomycetes bacterium]|nr:FHA domain-containing protein [Planctomycetota bacterium]